MTPHPASQEDPICYNCNSPVLRSDLKNFDYRCPHCDARLSQKHVNRGAEKIGEIRLHPSTIQRDIDLIKSLFNEGQFVLDVTGPEPPEGAQQLGITLYRNHLPPEGE